MTTVGENKLTNYLKIVKTILWSSFIKHDPKIIKYGSYKNYNGEGFSEELD